MGESVFLPFSAICPSSSTTGGGGGGRDERSGLKRSEENGKTRAGWRRRKEDLNPSQAALSPSAAFTCRGE